MITVPVQVGSCSECPNLVHPGSKGGDYPVYCNKILETLFEMPYPEIIAQSGTISAIGKKNNIDDQDLNMFEFPGTVGGHTKTGVWEHSEGDIVFKSNLQKIHPQCPYEKDEK